MAEALLGGAGDAVTGEDARLLLRYVSQHAIGDGKTNRVRVLIALARKAAGLRAPFLTVEGFCGCASRSSGACAAYVACPKGLKLACLLG